MSWSCQSECQEDLQISEHSHVVVILFGVPSDRQECWPMVMAMRDLCFSFVWKYSNNKCNH